ncbi:MAG: precorrin-6A reductase [Clostridia bacterium]|nr:MAG: precorrin-6A reductase [Clostridia bacterium]
MGVIPGDTEGVPLVILVLAGTSDAGEIINELATRGLVVLASSLTAYGTQLARAAGAGQVLTGPLDAVGMEEVLARYPVRLLVDATHPFATGASAAAHAAALRKGVPYLRWERPPVNPTCPGIYRPAGWEESARMAFSLGRVVFLTVGTRHLAPFAAEAAREPGRRLVVRILPVAESLAFCHQCGLLPSQIVAMQGPFSRELNRALFSFYRAEVVVTKESGPQGGVAAKIAAAQDLHLPVVIVERPASLPGPATGRIEEIVAKALEVNKAENWGDYPGPRQP